MRSAGAAGAFQMNSIADATGSSVVDSVAGFVRALEYTQLLFAELKHCRHEWHAIQAPVLIEGTEDFFFAPY